MYAHLDRIVFRRKTESVPSHRMYNVVSLLQLITTPYVGNHISSPMSDMKSVSGRIWEHIQTIVFLFLVAVVIKLRIYRILFPVLTPFFFNCLVIIDNFLCHFFKSFLFVLKKKPFHLCFSRDEKTFVSVVPLFFIQIQCFPSLPALLSPLYSGCTHSFYNGKSRFCLLYVRQKNSEVSSKHLSPVSHLPTSL